jgi:hypothetical protein
LFYSREIVINTSATRGRPFVVLGEKYMANVKNFGLEGVASSVQLGKGGANLVADSGKIAAKTADGSALTNFEAADPIASQDVVTKTYLDSQTGMTFNLGTPTDNGLASGAVPLTSTTTVTNAVDKLNEILGKLVPTSPATFPGGQTLTVTGAAPFLLAGGTVPDNTAGGTLPVTAGSSVSRVTAATVSSSTIGDNGTTGFVGPGDSGTVQALVNGSVVDSQAMTGGVSKASGVLRISNDNAYPAATPGFWYSFRAAINGATATQGWNRLSLNDTAASATPDVYFVRDNITATPVVSSGTVGQSALGTVAYSSSVPHYNTGASLVASFNATNLAGETYVSGNVLALSASNGILNTVGFAAGAGGLPNPIVRQTTSFTATNLALPVSGTNVFAKGNVTATAYNPSTPAGGAATFGPTILVMNGTQAGKVYEMAVPVSIAANGGPSVANAQRVTMGNGDNPADNKSALTVGDWVSSAALNAWDATVVAGQLQFDQNDYSTYLPAGPTLTTQNATQYVTFFMRRTAVSKFDIVVTGTYAGMWVKAVGLTEANTVSANGWYSMFTSYAGAGFPGDTNGANGSLGCALGGVATGTGTGVGVTATFGTLSTTNATNNIIMVRFKLTAGQSITALSFNTPSH